MVDLAITIARMQMATEDAERCFNMFILIKDIINILQMTTLICPSDHDSLVTSSRQCTSFKNTSECIVIPAVDFQPLYKL